MALQAGAPGAPAERPSDSPLRQQMAEAAPKAQHGFPAAFGTGGGAAIVFRDLASI